MRGDQLSRQWRILQYLSNNTRGRHLDEIAREVNCSPRNLRRDLQALQEAGFGIYQEKHGQTTLWKTSDAISNNPPIPLTMIEILSMLIAQTELQGDPDDLVSGAFAQVMQKILKSRPPEFRKQMELLQDKFHGASSRPARPQRSRKDVFAIVSSAIAGSDKITAVYSNAAGKRSTNRILAPLHVWLVNNSRYLVAFCYRANQMRTFHLNRFQSVEVLPEKFENTWGFDMHRHAEETFGVFHADPETITLWFDPILKTYLEDHPIHQSQVITSTSEGLHVRLHVGINESLVSKLMSFGCLARVLSPDRLALLIMERHRAAHEHYQAPLPHSGENLPLKFA